MFFNGKYKVKRYFRDVETHEVFLDKLAKARESEFGFSEKKLEVRIKEKIIYLILGLFFVLSLILFSRTLYLQVFQGNQLYLLSQNNKGKISLIRPERGIIYDKNLKKLVLNAPAYDLVCDRTKFSTFDSESLRQVENISKILNKDPKEIEEKIITSRESIVLISENLNQENLLVLEARINDLPYCEIEKNTVRNYVFGPAFSHLLGYMGRISKEEYRGKSDYAVNDYLGKIGLENYYEKTLRGLPGKLKVVKTATGIEVGDEILSQSKEGYNIVLNIDSNLQSQVYNSLEKSIKNIGAKKGAAVALDPRSGAVLAMVSYPSYDNNVFSFGISEENFNKLQSDPNQPFFNRAISSKYPTGSTIKPFIASAALQEKIISPDKLINDPGYILIQNQYDPSITYRFGGVKPHGLVDIRKALAVSSNIYFYTVGGGYKDQRGLGPTRIKKYLDLFNWEQKAGIDLPGEFAGFVPGPDWKKQHKNENWWDGDTYNLSIGQSDLQVTPLQVAVAYSSIANGGKLYKPQVAQKVIEGSGQNARIVEEFKPQIIRQNFIDEENISIVREGMRDCVQKTYGSCFMLSDLPVAVAGKTGTAETNKQGIYNTWSSNFAPYENPEIVFVATIEGVEGLRAATLPVAHEVLQYYFTRR